jgi:hypothetical protein
MLLLVEGVELEAGMTSLSVADDELANASVGHADCCMQLRFHFGGLRAERATMITKGWQLLVCLGMLLASAGVGQAQELNWAERMFSDLNCDLGTVAHRSELRHRLEIRNLYEERVYIRNVKKNCGCTEFTLSADEIATFESAYIDLSFNTTDFLNEKQSSIDVTVAFDGGGERIVHVPIRYFVRRDIVFTPGAAEFAEVVAGEGAERMMQVEYSGNSNWQITEMQTSSEHIHATATQTDRRNGHITYELRVNVDPTAPMGAFREQIVLTTTDANNPQMSVMVTGEVVPDIVVNTALQDMGELEPGATRNFTIIIRGREPFVVSNVESASENGSYFQVRLPQDAKAVQIIPMSFEAPMSPGAIDEEFLVSIEGRDEPVRFRACATVVGETPTAVEESELE